MKKTYQNAKRLTLLVLSFMLLSYVHGQIVITGTVMDGEFGGGLPGANVIVKGTSTGTSTDIDGKYTIKVADESAVLVFSSIGFASQSIKVGDKRVIDLTLKKDVKQIEEVVKVGYGVQKRQDVTGSVSQIGGDDIASRPVVGVDQAIQGKVSGVQVTSNSGSPGSDALVRIRGTGSINNSDPLYVVDGIPQSGTPQINPTEIKSISVLKDASACAIYGSRAANGVVLISTKEGKMGKKAKSGDCESSSSSEISVDGYYGIQNIEKTLSVMDARQYYTTLKKNGNTLPANIPSYVDTTGKGTNWQKQIYRPAPTQRYTIAYETGSDNSSFRMSGSFLKQDGIVHGSDYQSVSIGGKGNHNLKKWLTIQETFGYSNSIKNQIPEGAGIDNQNPVLLALLMDPTVPVKSENIVDSLKGKTTKYYNPVFNQIRNPMRVLDLNNQQNRNNGMGGSFAMDIKPFKELVLRSQVGVNGYYNTYTNYQKTYYQSSPLAFSKFSDPNLDYSYDYGYSYTLTNTATFSKDFMDKHDSTSVAHSLSVLVGNEIYYTKSDGYEIVAHNMNEILANKVPHLSESDSLAINKSKVPSEKSMVSMLGRINYAYKNRYLLTSNVRYDWSSRFVKGNRLGIFPSFSAGWKLSDENFFKNNEKLKHFNECKVRFGWGQIGNENILNDERYPSASRMTSVFRYYSFNGVKVPGATIDNTPNSSLKWETTEMTNIGIDIALLQNKITLSLDAFRKKTKGMLVNLTLPMIVGAERDNIYNSDPQVAVNGGSILNTGMEATLSYKGKIEMKHKLEYEMGGNIAVIKNQVLSIGDEKFIKTQYIAGDPLPGLKTQLPSITAVGYGIADFYGLKVQGIYQTWDEVNKGPQMASHTFKPGDYKYEDVNGDGVIDDKDYVHLGSPLPKLTYGFYLNGSISFVDFNFTFQGSYGNKIYNATKAYTQSMNQGWNNTTNRLNAWTETNPSSTETRLSSSPKDQALEWDTQSSAYIESGSYLRLKDVVIGFTLPEKFAKKLKLNKLRVYAQLQNAITWTKYSGYDPEVGQLSGSNSKNNTLLGVDLGTYPHARTFLGGFNFSF
jgi:TonB-dependent starch-binding outer membrane protein SusC